MVLLAHLGHGHQVLSLIEGFAAPVAVIFLAAVVILQRAGVEVNALNAWDENNLEREQRTIPDLIYITVEVKDVGGNIRNRLGMKQYMRTNLK